MTAATRRTDPYCVQDGDLRGHKPADLFHDDSSPGPYGARRSDAWMFSEELALRMCCEPENECWMDCVDSAGEHLMRHLANLADLPDRPGTNGF